MVKQRSKGSIVVIEGLWGIGKSSLIVHLRQFFDFLFIIEPNFKIAGIRKGVSTWYKKEHKKRMNLALEYAREGESILMERSIFSSAAFYYARTGKLPRWFDKNNIVVSTNIHYLFLYDSQKEFNRRIKYIEDPIIRIASSKNNDFYEKYIEFFTKLLPSMNIPVWGVKFKNDLDHIHEIILLLRKLLKTSLLIKKIKKEEVQVCATAVILYKNKILTIFSPKHNQFAFPQGHREKNESLSDTIIREIREETGFVDVKIIRKFWEYRIRFKQGNSFQTKKISCFLVRLKSLKKMKKNFEKHEFYINRFIDKKKVIEKLFWPEDKNAVRLALKNSPGLK